MTGQDRQQDARGVLGVVVDLEPAAHRPGRGAERLSGAEVAREPRERAPADLHADPVPGPDPVGRSGRAPRPPPGSPSSPTRTSAAGTVCGLSRRMPSTMLRETPLASTSQTRTNRSACWRPVRTKIRALTGPTRSWLAGKGLAGIGQHVGPGFDRRGCRPACPAAAAAALPPTASGPPGRRRTCPGAASPGSASSGSRRPAARR